MTELAKTYEPQSIEDDVAALWKQAGAFDAEPGDPRGSYCIVIPPPNVTAQLHLGHALNNTLQDVLIRWKRMQQFNALWMPGTDHAGIATQTVVDKRLQAEGKPALSEYRRLEQQGAGGREQFVARVQEWKDEYEARILEQLKQMGCSCDWRRTRFTMDEVCARAVRENFFSMFADELIYRGKRLVNWDPATQTVLADDEVEHETVAGHFWYLQYPLTEPVEADGETYRHVTVATTRPETMLGDTAVAMNPADPRAGALVGRTVRLPIVGREIPIIADDHVVLPDPDSDDEQARFSTGFLKVTPAHDPNDYEIGRRHDLPRVNVMAPDGSISDRHGWDDADAPEAQQLLGMDRFEAREAIVEWFRRENLLADVREYSHSVGHSYRSHVPIEPYLSDQWYVAVKKPIERCRETAAAWAEANPELCEQRGGQTFLKDTDVPVDSLAGLALAPLMDGRLEFTPERYAKNYRTWLENLRDWPISRQLWWGHRIPIWTRDLELNAPAGPEHENRGPRSEHVAALDAVIGGRWSEIFRKHEVRYVLRVEPHPEQDGWIRTHVCLDRDEPGAVELLESHGWTRDPDVLDTWFSSALWPFSTLGWPERTGELETFYPTDVLCTAREIITLWVSRMVMMGQYCLGDIPFSDVFIHAMIQDGEGRKMSKSLGNGIDPLDIIDSHGADAMRFTLVSMTTQTQDVRMPVETMTLPDGRTANTSPKFDIGRNFCNKLWNASRFAMMNLDALPAWEDIRPSENLADRWILSRLNGTIRDVTGALEGFRFNEVGDRLYHFMWDDFCDWYLEIAKARINAGEDTPKAILAHVLDSLLRLLHPVAPFITEAIWRKLNEVAPRRGPGDESAEELLVKARWPRADAAAIAPDVEERFALLQDLIRQARNARTQHNVPPQEKVHAVAEASGRAGELVREASDLLTSQAGLDELTIRDEPGDRPPDAAGVTAGGVRMYLVGIVDVEAERKRLGKQKETLVKGIRGIEGKLGNEKFVTRAPPEIVERERERLAELQGELDDVERALDGLG